jgi:integrase
VGAVSGANGDVNLTDKRIAALTPKAGRYSVHAGSGLYLEVWPSGAKSWRLRFMQNRHRRRINLGRFPEVNLETARAERDRLTQAIKAGRSPAEERRKQAREALRGLTVKQFGERYLSEVVEQTRKDAAPIRRYLSRDVYPAIGAMPVPAVQAEHVREIVFAIRDAGHGQAAVAVRNLLKRIWDYALACGVTSDNPIRATPVKFIAIAKARNRALNEAEIRLFLNRLDAAPLRSELKSALRLILLTLTRKSEVRLARWEHINLERREWEIPQENSKTGAGQIVYLSRQAIDILERLRPSARRAGYIFPALGSDGNTPIGQSTLNRALDRVQRGMTRFTVHDLRRTGATRLSEMGYQPDVIEKALNHKLRGVRGIYNRAEYAGPRRGMLQAWADTLDRLQGEAHTSGSTRQPKVRLSA